MRKWQIDNALQKPEKDLKFETGDNKKYEAKIIIDGVVYY